MLRLTGVQAGAPFTADLPATVAARMRTEIERWSRVIEDAGIERQ